MALKDKLEEDRSMSEILQETKELNHLMTSYIRVHMNEESAQEMTIESQLERIRQNSDQIIQNMESVLSRQETLTERSKDIFQKVLTDGHKQLQKNNQETITKLRELQETNENKLQNINNDINQSVSRMESELKSVVRSAESEAQTLVSKAKKGAMASYWVDAFKYGLATSVIAVPLLLLAQWLLFS